MSESSSPIPYPRLVIVLAAVLLLGLIFLAVDLSPSLRHLDVTILSGPAEGNYRHLAGELRERGLARRADVKVVESAGSADNLARLAAASESCEAHYALTQDGIAPPEGSELFLVARLRKSESLFLIGKEASAITRFDQLRRMTIGAGPAGSGTDHLMRQVFEDPDMAPLGVTLENGDIGSLLDRLGAGELLLGGFVVDEDATLIRDAVRERGLELAAFANLDVIARKHPHLWHGRIGAGQFDPIAMLPPGDRRVLRVDTLVVGNGCASHAQTVGMLSLLAETFPGLVEHNRTKGDSALFAHSSTANAFYQHGEPHVVEQHVPWLVDIMPPSNWVYVVMSVSLLFNVMGFGHRFRLWRLDADRVKVEERIFALLGRELTNDEIHDMLPTEAHRTRTTLKQLDPILETLGQLRERCRTQSVSMLVPMGQEMAYRYQEDQLEQAIAALRRFRHRVVEALGAGDEGVQRAAEPTEEPTEEREEDDAV